MYCQFLQSSPLFFPKSTFPTPNPPLSCCKKDASFPSQFSPLIENTALTLQFQSPQLPNESDLALINEYCKRGKLQKAFQIYNLMTAKGYQPTVRTYNSLLKGLCYVGRVEEAFELMAEIKKSSATKPDIYTYTAMMDGFCKVGRSDEAMELLSEAVESGLEPTPATFNTLFHGYAKEGRPLEGIRALKTMKQGQCKPDYITYSTLIRGLLVWKKTNSAVRMYREMVESGFEGDERLMNSFLRGLCRKYVRDNVMLEDAHQVFDEMRHRGFAIDLNSYSLIVEALSVGKEFEDAFVVLKEMVRVGYVPRMRIVNRLMGGFCREGKVEKAVMVLGMIWGSCKMPNRTSYELVIRELNGKGRLLEAAAVYGAALIRGTVPNVKPQQK